MSEYKIFFDSLVNNKNNINILRESPKNFFNENNKEILKIIFETIYPMKSKVRIVAHSKVLAHYFKDFICPIDREYTMQFLKGLKNKRLPKFEQEFDFFFEFNANFIQHIIKNKHFLNVSNQWLNSKEHPWDTSLPKIVDNLIVGKISNAKLAKKNGA